MAFSKILCLMILFFQQIARGYQIFSGCGGFSLSFDGRDDYVQIESPQCSVMNPFDLSVLTYETWFFFYSFLNPYQWVMGQGGDYGIHLMREGTTNNIGFVNTNGVDQCFQSMRCANITEKTWYHIAVSFNGSHFFLYCNGQLPKENVINCTGQGAPGKWDTRMDIGQDHKQPKSRNTFGIIDEMRIWKKFLTLDEINEKRFRSLSSDERNDANLSFYYTFDQGFGDILIDDSLYLDKINMTGNLGGKNDDFRIASKPLWAPSTLNLTNGPCVYQTKYGKLKKFFSIPVFKEEKGIYTDITNSLFDENLTLIITLIPNGGNLFYYNAENDWKTIENIPFYLNFNNLSYESPMEGNIGEEMRSIFQYCVFSTKTQTTINCNEFIFLITNNHPPFAGTAGHSLFFDGVDDYAFSEEFLWPAKEYSRGYGGGPVTIEWWGANYDKDFQLDNILASGSSVFSVGSTEVVGLWCENFCYGRFQGHAPWVDGYLTFDYGWSPGLRGRTTKKMFQYLNKWTHYAFVSDGKNGDFQGIYLDGDPFLLYDPSSDDANALPADGTSHEINGFFLGCWPYFNLCFRGYIDEFRIWNSTRTREEIKNNMNRKIMNDKNLHAYFNFNKLINGTIIEDFSDNNFFLKFGGCSNKSDWFGNRIYCNKSFENETLSNAYPQFVESSALIDDEIHDIITMEKQNFSFLINATDLNGDEIEMIFLTSTEKTLLFYEDKILKKGDVIRNKNYFYGVKFNQFEIVVVIQEDFAGYPLENFSFCLSDGISNSSLIEININVFCDVGRFFENNLNKCVSCPPGYYNNLTNQNSCFPCALGYYQPLNNSLQCEECKDEYTTLKEGELFCVYYFQNCIFKSDLKNNDFGVIFNIVVVSINGTVLLIILIYFSRQKKKTFIFSKTKLTGSIKMNESSKKKIKISLFDFMEIINQNFSFMQLMYLSIIIDPSKENELFFLKIMKTFLSITNFNLSFDALLSFISLSKDSVMLIQLSLHVLTLWFTLHFFLIMSLNQLKERYKCLQKPSLIKIIKSQMRFCYWISEFFFIPIIISLFRIYSCTLETDENQPFLDFFCEFQCWQISHIAGIISSSFLIIFFSYLFLSLLPEMELVKKEKKLHFIQDEFFKQIYTLFKIMLSSISVLLAFNSEIMIFFLFGCEIFIFIASLWKKPYGNIQRLNIMLIGEFFILVLTSFSSILGLTVNNINLNYIIFPIWGGGVFIILVLLLSTQDLLSSLQSKISSKIKPMRDLTSNAKSAQMKMNYSEKNVKN